MPWTMFRRMAVRVLLVVPLLYVSSCTPEKAQALLTAAKTFQTQADAALVAVQDLFIAANQTLPQTRAEAIASFIRGAKGHVSKGGGITNKDVIDRLGKTGDRQIRVKITSEFAELRQYYAAFADSLTSLPQGSYFATEGVACTVDVAVRLTGSLINYAKDLKTDPILPKRKISDLRAQLVAEFNQAQPDDAKVMSLTHRLDEIIQDGYTANEEAIRLFLVAAEQGRQVSMLAKKYDDVSIADILTGVQKGLTIAGTIRGLDTNSMITRLGGLRTDMENDKYWKRILALPVDTPSDNCKLGAKA